MSATQTDEAIQIRIARLRERGPAVILGNPDSLFVRQLGRYWQRLGLDVRVVSTGPGLPAGETSGVPVIDSRGARPVWTRALRPLNPALRWLERSLPRLGARRYRARTGHDAPPPWAGYWVDHFWDSFSRARAALRLKPAFVFGQEAAAYGLATALCRGVPRVVFPWGADIYLSCEASPPIAAMMKYALRRVELIVPSSTAARQRICERFRVSPEKVIPVSWGVDLDAFRPLRGDERRQIRERFGIPPDATVLFNARRFDPLWGAAEAVDACLAAAAEHASVFCVFPGAGHNPEHLAAARERVAGAGLSSRFAFFERTLSLDEYAQLAGASEIALSLMSQADMRSSSVLQVAAAGAVPVVGDSAEYRGMAAAGFQVLLVDPVDAQQLAGTLRELIGDPARRARIAEANRRYLAEHEDHDRQMHRLLELIAALVFAHRPPHNGT